MTLLRQVLSTGSTDDLCDSRTRNTNLNRRLPQASMPPIDRPSLYRYHSRRDSSTNLLSHTTVQSIPSELRLYHSNNTSLQHTCCITDDPSGQTDRRVWGRPCSDPTAASACDIDGNYRRTCHVLGRRVSRVQILQRPADRFLHFPVLNIQYTWCRKHARDGLVTETGKPSLFLALWALI